MGIHKKQLLTGAVLSVLVGGGLVSPALANPTIQVAQASSSTANYTTFIGFVRGIVGDVVTIQEATAPFRTLRINKRVQGIAGLVPGMKIKVTYIANTDIVQQLVVLPNYKLVATSAVRNLTVTRTQTQTTTVRPLIPVRPPTTVRPMAPMTPPPPQPAAPTESITPAAPAGPVRGLW
jgi:hypothetical protein